MTNNLEEVITVKVPKGTREAFRKIADKNYLPLSTLARTLIMKAIEEDRAKTTRPAA